jgi:hypothetical protein
MCRCVHVRDSNSLRMWNPRPLHGTHLSLRFKFQTGKLPTPTSHPAEVHWGPGATCRFSLPSGEVQRMESFVLHVRGNVTFHNNGACNRDSHTIRDSIVQDAFTSTSEEIVHTCSTCSKYLQSAESFSPSRGSAPTQPHLNVPMHLQ